MRASLQASSGLSHHHHPQQPQRLTQQQPKRLSQQQQQQLHKPHPDEGQLLSKLHLARKKRMIETTKGARVLDLASGRCGDLWNFCHARTAHVDGVEPDTGNREQGLLRLAQNLPKLRAQGFMTTFRTIAARAEMTSDVLQQLQKDYVDVTAWRLYDFVTAFFCMTFFFRDREMLLGHLHTVRACLKSGGIYMGVMLDGTELRRTLLSGLQTGDTLKTSVFSLTCEFDQNKSRCTHDDNDDTSSFAFGQQVHIHFHSTKAIVKEQTEYLTDFTIMTKEAAALDLDLVAHALIQPEAMLQDEHVRAFSAAHRMFAFKRR